ALGLARQRGDDAATAVVLNNLGITLSGRGEFQQAEELLWESLRRKQHLGAAMGCALTLLNLSDLAQRRGDIGQAEMLARRALAEAQRLNAPLVLAGTYNNLGEVARTQGDLSTATDMLERSLAIFEARDDASGIIMALRNLGYVARLQGDWQQARSRYHRALSLCRQSGSFFEGICCLAGWALLLNATGASHLATEFLGTTMTQCEQKGMLLPVIERSQIERAVREMREHLGAAIFEEHWQRGQSRTLFQALAMI
ncbi:MAG TPA: tetratricopeptide repeat-containing protein, partial [Ktedonobacterales bacterium]|nr:tetratricopeptide repeat-containing protein [Ktedonobacterales bacterium]